MKESGAFDPFATVQRAFPLSPAARQSAVKFWEGQDKVLDRMEEYANGWIERRHAGTRHAIESAQQICSAESPFDAMRELQKWTLGSVERMMQDGLACQKCVMDVAVLSVQPLEGAAEEARAEARSELQKQSRARAA